MISKKLFAVLAVVALGAGLAIAPAMAKKGCGKLCKDEKKDCLAAAKTLKQGCKQLTGEEKTACKAAAKQAKKDCIAAHKARLTECKATETNTVCDSPSAAFLD